MKWTNRRLRFDMLSLLFMADGSSDAVAGLEGSDKYFEADMSSDSRDLMLILVGCLLLQ
jgi:hypothetical protein